MNKSFVRLLLLCPLLFLMSFTHAANKALVIGNDDYSEPLPRLYNPIRDAYTVASALQSIGFSVMLRTDLNWEQFDHAVQEFAQTLQPSDIAFIYYAGHGLAMDGKDYLLPVAPQIFSKENVQHRAINAQEVLDVVASRGQHTVFVLDACRNNPFFRSTGTNGLGNLRGSNSSYILYAAKYGEQASDDGTFAQALAQELRKPQSLASVRVNVRRIMSQHTNGKQNPNAINDLSTDTLYLAGKPSTFNEPPPISQDDAWMERLWAWADEFQIPEEELPRNKEDLLAMTILNISRLNGWMQINYLPPEIGQLSQLRSLYLVDNQLQTLPKEIGQLNKLEELGLWNNALQTLPAEIGQLSALKTLNLWGNELHTLPPEIGQLSALKKLDLMENQLQTLPKEIGELNQLKELDLWNNDLRTLPDSFSNLDLDSLDISNNDNLQLSPAQALFISNFYYDIHY